MSPVEKASHKIKTSTTRAYVLLTTVSAIVAIFAAFTVSKSGTAREPTSPSVLHAAPAQSPSPTPTPTPRRRRRVVKPLPPPGPRKEPPQPSDPNASNCPSIGGCPRQPISDGSQVTLTAEWNTGKPRGNTKYWWSVLVGKLEEGQGTARMRLSTAGAGGKTVEVTLNFNKCSMECSFGVKPKDDTNPFTPTPFPPTPTVTTTPTPVVTHPVTPTPTTPTPTITSPPTEFSPTPTPTASPLVPSIATPSGDGTPPQPSTPIETPEPTPPPSNAGTTTIWAWILGILAALAAGAAFAVGAFRHMGGLRSAGHVESGGTKIERAENDLTAVILAAKKKKDEAVRCTVFAPYEAAPGDAFLVQAFAHLAEQAHLLSEIAKQASRDTSVRGSAMLVDVVRGEKLGFDLEMPGLEIDEPSQSLDWLGETASLKFGVTVPETFKPRSINCKLSVSRHGVPMGHIKFNFIISAAPQFATETTLNSHQKFVVYKLAFISYASADRSEVMKRVQMLDLAKIRYFQDLLSLESGKQWEPMIYRYIDECDVFYLFWSTAAKKSKWVKKEVERALKRRGDKFDAPPEIMGIPIEGPPAVKPPRSLESIHFDSKFLYFINPRDSD